MIKEKLPILVRNNCVKNKHKRRLRYYVLQTERSVFIVRYQSVRKGLNIFRAKRSWFLKTKLPNLGVLNKALFFDPVKTKLQTLMLT
jgi:hypothetical protein